MDYSTTAGQSSLFGNTAFGHSATTTSNINNLSTTAVHGTPDKNKEKRFHDWHNKQGITAPQDYGAFASQPAPFSSVQSNPNPPSAASPFLNKVLSRHGVELNANGGSSNDLYGDMTDARRKPSIKRTSSSSPPNAVGAWPKSMFGTRPPSRTRARTSSNPDIGADIGSTEDNAPPLMSFYDTYNPRAGASNNTTTSAPAQETTFNKPADMTPTQVRVANFSEDRFPDLIRALRRYYGPILEPYSGLPESESKFSDPEIVPRSQLDSATAKMVQPMSGSEGGPGPWVRITFRDREAAYKAVDDASRGELNVGGRTVIIGMWEKEGADAGLPFMMDIDTAPAGGRRMSRSGSFSGLASRRTGSISIFDEQAPATTNANGEQLSEHMSGFRVVVPKQVEFSKKDGWISGWTNLLLAKGTASAASRGNQGDNGWGSSLCRAYRYIMDEVVGFKYL